MKILFKTRKKKRKKEKIDTRQQLTKIWCCNPWCSVPIINNSKFRHRGFHFILFFPCILFAQKHFHPLLSFTKTAQNRTEQDRPNQQTREEAQMLTRQTLMGQLSLFAAGPISQIPKANKHITNCHNKEYDTGWSYIVRSYDVVYLRTLKSKTDRCIWHTYLLFEICFFHWNENKRDNKQKI